MPIKAHGIKSVLLTKLGTDNSTYLFCGFMDGLVKTLKYTFMQSDANTHNIEVVDEYSYFIGTVPVSLRELKYGKTHSVFASCETPSLIYINKDGNLISDHIHSHEIKRMDVVNIND